MKLFSRQVKKYGERADKIVAIKQKLEVFYTTFKNRQLNYGVEEYGWTLISLADLPARLLLPDGGAAR